jgi:hypothetical protein
LYPYSITVGIPAFSNSGITAMDCPEPEMPSIAKALSTSVTFSALPVRDRRFL